MKKFALLFIPLLVLVIAFTVYAQQDVMLNGVDSSANTRRILTDSSGRVVTTTGGVYSGATHGACTNTTMNVGTTGTACPPTARADRGSITIELVQAGESLRFTEDGVTAATATVGLQLASQQIFTDNLAGSVAMNCRCTVATCAVMILECP